MSSEQKKQIAIMFAIAGILAILALAYSYFIEPRRLVVNRQTIAIKNFDKTFDGLKIVAISDIHGGSNGADVEKIRHVVELSNAEEPDIVVLLGDYVSQDHTRQPVTSRPLLMPMNEVADGLAGLTAKYGIFAVLGNHDGWYGDDRVSKELERVGFRVLRNEIAPIEKDGHVLRLLGLTDHLHITSWNEFSSEVRQVTANDRQTGDLIILEHSPDVLDILNVTKTFGDEFKLMLAGHTHGGQVWLPILGAPIVPSSYGQKYAAGHVYDGGRDMFVTTGVGTSILPFRFMVPPEIAVLTIRSAE
jgi:predicted MPP superfamily phosphohydrolase